jgi:hypothetical protein
MRFARKPPCASRPAEVANHLAAGFDKDRDLILQRLADARERRMANPAFLFFLKVFDATPPAEAHPGS